MKSKSWIGMSSLSELEVKYIHFSSSQSDFKAFCGKVGSAVFIKVLLKATCDLMMLFGVA